MQGEGQVDEYLHTDLECRTPSNVRLRWLSPGRIPHIPPEPTHPDDTTPRKQGPQWDNCPRLYRSHCSSKPGAVYHPFSFQQVCDLSFYLVSHCIKFHLQLDLSLFTTTRMATTPPFFLWCFVIAISLQSLLLIDPLVGFL